MKFSELGLAERISTDLEKLGFTEPTEIQEKTIPSILAGHDIMASAETGSGKTAAYALPIVQALRGGSKNLPRALVLVPTRELAVQVSEEMVRFSARCGIRTVTIYGGVGFEKQMRLLKRGVDVIVATPGRLFDHINQGNAKLSDVKMLVLDEADRMLDMGFTPQVRRIVDEIKGPRQTVMFSATINKAVEKTGEEFLTNPISVCVNSNRVEPKSIEQKIHLVKEDAKTQLLVDVIHGKMDGVETGLKYVAEAEASSPELLLEDGTPFVPETIQIERTVLVFTRTRSRATKICKVLNAKNIRAGEIHSDISQNKRESTLRRFRDGQISVLIATDIAARGLDIPTISHVVNYDLPLSAADYVHRIGRTGRAGRSGIAVSFVSDDQRYLVRDIEKVTGRELDPNSPFKKTRDDSSYSSKGRNGRRRSSGVHVYGRRDSAEGNSDGQKKREFGSSGGQKREFGGNGGQKRDFGSNGGQKREFGNNGAQKREFGSNSGQRKRDFGNKSDFGTERALEAKVFGQDRTNNSRPQNSQRDRKRPEISGDKSQVVRVDKRPTSKRSFDELGGGFFEESLAEFLSSSGDKIFRAPKPGHGANGRNNNNNNNNNRNNNSSNDRKPSRNKVVKIGKRHGNR